MSYETDISTQMLAFPCAICGKVLRDPISLERGWGPICDDKYMGGAGAAMVSASMEAFDEAETEAALASAPNIVPQIWQEPVPGSIRRTYKKGETLPDGSVADGYVIEADTRPLRVSGLRDYWESKGGRASDKRAPWRHDAEVRRTLVSNGIWYASRAMYYGYREDVVSAEKVDPRWLVVAAVQRLARAVGLSGAAERMTNFYGVQVRKFYQSTAKQALAALGGKAGGRVSAIVFEEVPPGHSLEVWNAAARRREFQRFSGPLYRLHVPYSEEFNRLARATPVGFAEPLFLSGQKDPPYYWRYFDPKHLREVINIVQGIFDDKPAITRKMTSAAERRATQQKLRTSVLVLDVQTQEMRWFSKTQARQLCAHGRYQEVKV